MEFAVGGSRPCSVSRSNLMYGQAGATDGGFPGKQHRFSRRPTERWHAHRRNQGQHQRPLDLNTDVGGMIEIKWIYTEFR